MRKILISIYLLSILSLHSVMAQQLPYQDATLPVDQRVEDLLSRMTMEEKVKVMTGITLGGEGEPVGSMDIPRLGIPNFKIEHGPYGFKGWFKGDKAMSHGVYFPVSIAQAATWNREVVEDVNAAMGSEMHAAGGHANAGPAMNIIRDPRGGRSFEYFSEDPYLTGEIATAYVKGLQSEKVMANLKHYACNNQELNRHAVSVIVDKRTLNELYLYGFKKAIQEGGAWSVMGAYNRINGVYCCEDPYLLTEVLHNDWGFDGFVVSDWSATHSTAESVNAGLSMEMPRPKWYGDKLEEAVRNGEVSEETLNLHTGNILRGLFWTGTFDEEPSYDKSALHTDASNAIARQAATESMVLLKNNNSLLPFDVTKIKNLAVIGPNGSYGLHYNGGDYSTFLLQGGGSAHLRVGQEHVVTPLQGIKNALKGSGVNVEYHNGCYAETGCGSIPAKYLRTPDGESGLKVTYFNNVSFEGEAVKTTVDEKFVYMWNAALPIPEAGMADGDDTRFSVLWEGKITAPATRDYIFEARNTAGDARIYINNKLVVENIDGSRLNFCNQNSIKLEKGEVYDIKVEYIKTGGLADVRIGWDYENIAWLEEAKELAAKSDAVVMTVGLSGEMGEAEAGDRKHLNLFPAQEKLINEIAKVNKNVVVALTAGSAITMQNWMDNTPSILLCWYAGQQGGNALADLLFGKANPSGKLPITFPLSLRQYPDDFYSTGETVEYKEGVYVGYKYFEEYNKPVLFPFGYGLSYTTFKYDNLKCKVIGKNRVEVTIDVTNSGAYQGKEVVQLYVGDVEASVSRPAKELREFQKIDLKSGETKSVKFILDSDAFAFWSPQIEDWTVEPGEYNIFVGSSSANTIKNSIEL